MTAGRTPVAVLGATGVVGQRFVRRLAEHPLFELDELVASAASAGKTYAEACAWRLEGDAWAGVGDRPVLVADPETITSPIVFSALDSGPAHELEPRFAAAGALVFSNASAYRMAEDVPLLVPEVNPQHLGLLQVQKQQRGWPGGIVCNPNCTAAVLVMALAPLHEAFGVEAVSMTSMQAVSGAGYPGVASLDVLGNVIPSIAGEEEKLPEEVPKMLGTLSGDRIEPAPALVSATCTRVPVLDGHLESVSVRLRGDPGLSDVEAALRDWAPLPQQLGLPSAPVPPLRLHRRADRPQPRLDASVDGGMPVHVGNLRRCPVLGVKLTVLGHNTERGAAGGSVLNAELAMARGLIGEVVVHQAESREP